MFLNCLHCKRVYFTLSSLFQTVVFFTCISNVIARFLHTHTGIGYHFIVFSCTNCIRVVSCKVILQVNLFGLALVRYICRRLGFISYIYHDRL
ncbi:hypothetical protein HanHA300_Chr17g0639301 [Helianthus annuus]|nr:hypothetical protein HanHA300_Chr17g0639301 [Helianthus annuus]KAJ0446128.1 hypothetical protein HanHA89_Chr17g0690941 [Helianthus annuus]KAJ0631086.1 hypothetical protein HanLR1_Chr17g0650191 [Helianthus annuus]